MADLCCLIEVSDDEISLQRLYMIFNGKLNLTTVELATSSSLLLANLIPKACGKLAHTCYLLLDIEQAMLVILLEILDTNKPLTVVFQSNRCLARHNFVQWQDFALRTKPLSFVNHYHDDTSKLRWPPSVQF